MGVVYYVTNKVRGKGYVGKTMKEIECCRKEHETTANRKPSTYFLRALQKYGFIAFEWRVVARSDDKDELSFLERYFIKCLKTKVPNGYNLTDGGEGTAGYKMSQEAIERRTASRKARGIPSPMKGRKVPQEVIKRRVITFKARGMPSPMKGKHHTAESKAKTSKSSKGKVKTPEHLAKIAKALTGRKLSPGHIAAIKLNGMKGKHHSAESKAKIGAASKGKIWLAESRHKLSITKTGQPSLLKGKTYEDIYGDRANDYRRKRKEKRKIDWSVGAQQIRKENGKKAARTRRMNHMDGATRLEYQGRVLSLREWAAECGISAQSLWSRLARGWSLEKAVTTKKGECRGESQKRWRAREKVELT